MNSLRTSIESLLEELSDSQNVTQDSTQTDE